MNKAFSTQLQPPGFAPGLKLCLLLLLALTGARAVIAQTSSVVTVNADNVIVLNGRKVFTIGFSPGPPNFGQTPTGGDALQELRDAGALLFRITQSSNWDTNVIATQQAALDWAAQHDMYCWVNLRELSEFPASDTNTPASLRNIVDTFRNHPALGLWKNFDEAWWGGVSEAELQRGYSVIKQEDTNHPVVQTHAPRGTVSDLQPYNAAADVLAVDIYPITSAGSASNPPITNTQVSQVGDWTLELGQVANGQKNFWLIEQIAFSGTTPPAHPLVYPTFQQSRFMAYQAIINGARGLMFFGGNIAATLNAQDAPLGWNWTFWTNVLKPVVQQLGDHGALAGALVAPASTLPITLSGTTPPDVEFCVREVPPDFYILASKREGATVNVTFSGLPASAGPGEVLYESGRTVPAQNGQFTDSFAQWDVHVYHFYNTNQSPLIQSQPQGSTNSVGTTAAFSVTVSGTSPLGYRWKKNGLALSDTGNISGSGTPTLTLTNVQAADGGAYSVVVSNLAGTATSSNATLTVPAPVSISAQPADRTNNAGTSAAFAVGVVGSNPQFQWRKNGTNLFNSGNVVGATTAMLTLLKVLKADAAGYSVVVTNNFNSVTSAVATLAVIDPAITNQPIGQIAPPGGTAVFSVGAAGTPPLAYRWKKNGSDLSDGGNVSGAATPTLALSTIQSNDVAAYSVAVSNTAGVALSAPASLALQSAPVITSQPASRTNAAGTTATFSIGAQGNGLVYRWLRAGAGLSDGGNISGAGTATLSVATVLPADAVSYSVVITNAAGSVTSSPASLTVNFPLPYYEPFNYAAGSPLAGQVNPNYLTWSDVGTSTAGPSVGTVAGNLGATGLAPALGNSIQFGGLGKSARFSFASGTAVTSGTLYYSFILSILNTTGLSSSGVFFAGFNNSIGTQGPQPSVVGTRLYIRSAAGGFNLGVAKNSSTSNQWVWDSRVFTTNQPIFVVGGYTFNSATSSDDISTLWLNPNPANFGSNQPPAPSLTATDGSDMTANQIASFVFFQRDVTEPAAAQADELRIGTTWASVTPPQQTVTTLTGLTLLGNGAFRFAYTNNSGQGASVYASTNLVDWAAIGAATQISAGLFQFTDATVTNYPRRFYKLRSP